MTPEAVIGQAAAEGVKLALSPPDKIEVIGNANAVDRWLPVIRGNKLALVAALTRAANKPRSAPSVASVVRLRLILQQHDGTRTEAVLAIPKARYDGVRVLELFERHRMAESTRVVSVKEV